jgi:CRISPR-associated exonuclease Cas4
MTDALPLSLLNDFLYCPRRAALKIVEGWRGTNEHTNRGDIVHEHADLAGYEVTKGVLLLRALPVFSRRLGLSGRCDIVEVQQEANQKTDLRSPKSLRPVEFKVGKRRKWENDDAQLCAQALCLEEMFAISIPNGAIFHADSKRRREVEFTTELRTRVETAIMELHALLDSERVPAAVYKEACEECSLYQVCVPQLTSDAGRVARRARQLFET